MKTKCLIACTNEVINIGLNSLLSKQNDMECVGMYLDNGVNLKALVDRFQPDVLLLDRQHRSYPNLTSLFPLAQYPELLVIGLEIDRNLIQVYQKGDKYVSSTTDLLSVIRNRSGELS